MKILVTIFLTLAYCAIYAQTDSLWSTYAQALEEINGKKLDSLEKASTKHTDSIRASYTGRMQKLVSLKQRYSDRIDSIKNKKLSAPGNLPDTLNATAQLMYNIVDKDHRSPYTHRLNWSIGLEFAIKKKEKTQQ